MAGVFEAAVDPLRGEFFLHRVLREAGGEAGEVDPVQRLVLVEEIGRASCRERV